MIENITCQFSDSDRFINLFIPLLTIIASLIISLFVVVFTESYKQKKDFDSIMDWFEISVNLLDNRLKSLKNDLNLGIKEIEKNPKIFHFHLIDFPKLSLTVYDEIISKGYWKFVSLEDTEYLGSFKDYVDELSLAKTQYDQIIYLGASVKMPPENFDDLRISNYKRFIKSIDAFNEKMEQFKSPQYQSIFKRILNSIKERIHRSK